MTESSLEKLKYPIGKFTMTETVDETVIHSWISEIESLPDSIEILVKNLSIEALNFPYRPQGWNIKQVVHHLADSHMNAFIRFKLALTEEAPIIKPYEEDRWAQLEDGTNNDIGDSFNLLKHLHAKWGRLLRTLTADDLLRGYIHPEHGKRFRLDEAIGMYAWHSNHHLAHIKQALYYKDQFN